MGEEIINKIAKSFKGIVEIALHRMMHLQPLLDRLLMKIFRKLLKIYQSLF